LGLFDVTGFGMFTFGSILGTGEGKEEEKVGEEGLVVTCGLRGLIISSSCQFKMAVLSFAWLSARRIRVIKAVPNSTSPMVKSFPSFLSTSVVWAEKVATKSFLTSSVASRMLYAVVNMFNLLKL